MDVVLFPGRNGSYVWARQSLPYVLPLLAAACMLSLPAAAQTTTELRPQVDPSVVQQQNLERDLTRPKDPNAPLKPTDEKEKPVIETGTGDGAGPAALDGSPRFVLQELLVNGVTVFKSEDLEAVLSSWIDREVGQAELQTIADEITALYKKHGYITSRAFIPSQDIQGGSVTIQVVEGRIEDIRVEGNKYVREGYIRARITQQPGEVFRIQALEADMLDLSMNSLLDKTHATLKAGDAMGTSDIVISIDDHRPYHLQVGVDNFGRKGIGLWRTNITAWHENLLGYGDSAVASVSLADHTTAVAGQYKFPLGTRGWAVGANFGYTDISAGRTKSRVLIDDELRFRRITADSTRFSLFTEFPLYRTRETRRWNVNGTVALNFIDATTYLDDVPLQEVNHELRKRVPGLQVDKQPVIRTLTSRLQALEQDRLGRWIMGAGMTNAFVGLGGNVAYAKFNADVTRIQALPWGLIGVFRVEGQMTPNRLPFAEKMQIGGSNTVRGFPEGYLIADKGYLTSAEVRFPLKFLPRQIESGWQGLVFAEHGGLFTENDPYGSDSTDGQPGYLTGYGVGLRGQVTKLFNLRVDLAIPVNRRTGNQDVRAHFSVNSQLF